MIAFLAGIAFTLASIFGGLALLIRKATRLLDETSSGD